MIDTDLLGVWKADDGNAKIAVSKLTDYHYSVCIRDHVFIVTPCPVDDLPLYQVEAISIPSSPDEDVNFNVGYWLCWKKNNSIVLSTINRQHVPVDTPTKDELLDLIRQKRRHNDFFVEKTLFHKSDEKGDESFNSMARINFAILQKTWNGEHVSRQFVMKEYASGRNASVDKLIVSDRGELTHVGNIVKSAIELVKDNQKSQVLQLFYRTDTKQTDHLNKFIDEWARVSSEKIVYEPIKEFVVNDIAIIAILQKRIDVPTNFRISKACLIKVNGEWLILPDIEKYSSAINNIGEKSKSDFLIAEKQFEVYKDGIISKFKKLGMID